VDEWKQELEENFKHWLDMMAVEARGDEDAPFRAAATLDDAPTPDLYAFFEALCALRSDVSKSSRRSHETFVRFSETLEGFEGTLRELSDRLSAERRERASSEQAAQKRFLLPYAELLERLNRLAQKLAQPPQPGFFSARRQWAAAWASFEQGFVLLREHFELLLRDAGIVAMETVGLGFDPTRMKAVAVEENASLPHNTVIEEITAGYLHKDEVLKFAEVKIAINKGSHS
jgi:hypothetical protein